MFSLIKKRAYLKDLIIDNYTDIHSHILPGIDDGARDEADSLFLVNELVKIGFARAITTPHVMHSVWDNTRSGIEGKLSATKKFLNGSKTEMPLAAAAEYLLDNNFVKLFNEEPLLTVKDQYVLVEMSYLNPPIQLYHIIFEMQVSGYKPILAHPERYLFFHNNFEEYAKLKHAGCLFQLNLLSVVGYYGIAVAETAKKLLDKGFIDFTGSDVHHENHITAFERRITIKDVKPLQAAMTNNQMFQF